MSAEVHSAPQGSLILNLMEPRLTRWKRSRQLAALRACLRITPLLGEEHQLLADADVFSYLYTQ